MSYYTSYLQTNFVQLWQSMEMHVQFAHTSLGVPALMPAEVYQVVSFKWKVHS